MNDDRLDRLRSGDESAFRALVDEHQNRVVNVCYRFLRNEEDARDTAQEVFLDVYRALPGFRGEAELSTWIHRIAMTKSLDALRRRSRKKRLEGLAGTGGSEEIEREAVSGGPDPGQALEERERAALLHEAIDTLPRSQRIAVTLAKYEEMSSAEIARILGTSPGAVDSLVYRAQASLRRKLARSLGRRLAEKAEMNPAESRSGGV
jgi:RNA polymerase sigma-70 factor (ECF subfamily)